MDKRKEVIVIKDLEKTYFTTTPPTRVLKGINLVVYQGDFIAIMGASGSGKSTLMNILGLLDQPTKGKFFFDGKDTTKLSESQRAKIRNQNIGFIFQAFHLLSDLTALENVELPMIYANLRPKERKKRAIEALRSVGLGDRLHYRPNELSGGQMQRVAIARALVLNPNLILGDELTGNLDNRSAQEVMKIITKLNKEGKTILIITHENDIALYAQKILHLAEGKILPGPLPV